jgi:hypothetical protein
MIKNNKYINGKIYKIQTLNADEKIYIGSTTNKLYQRMARHRYDYKKYKDQLKTKTSCYDLFDKYGIDNCIITLIENYPCNSKEELLRKEAEYIRDRQIICVNKYIPLRTQIQYREENKDIIKERKRIYYLKNKDKISEKSKKAYLIKKQNKIE